MKKIVISIWLYELGRDMNEECIQIPNGIDSSIFFLENPVEAMGRQDRGRRNEGGPIAYFTQVASGLLLTHDGPGNRGS